jgi:DNA-binding response OmpR family regulator
MPKLLLCDDSTMVQRMIAMTFAAEDISVTMVSDGEQAITRIVQDRPDIVLAGIGTPKRNGYDVAAYIKSDPRLASIPVLLLAGAFEPVDQVRAAQVRCDGVLVKPLEPQQVVARVKELIAGASGSTGVATSGVPRPIERLTASTPLTVTAASPAAAPRTPDTTPNPNESLDDYFEQLDAAFAQRSGPVPPVRTADSGIVPTLDSVLEPSTPAVAGDRAPVVTDLLVDEVTRRVVERLGTTALRDVVADVVSDVAERLIREEIARIRTK